MSVRSEERLAAATLRAVARRPGAEIRGHRLEVDRRPVGIVVPHLSLEFEENDERRRGVVDALALRLLHSDRATHLELSPTVPVERIVFDICEQFRCEALSDPSLVGVRENISTAFDRWSDRAIANGIGETGTGLLVFTITHMLRARLLKRLSNENVDDLIETTRATLGRLIGHALGELLHLITDQAAFSEPALEIARLISEMLDDAAPDGKHTRSAVERNLILVPIGWDALAEEVAADWLTDIRVDSAADYNIYSKAHDVQCHAEDLYRPYVLRRLRKDLDRAVTQQAVSVTRLAQRLGVLFHQPVDGGLRGGQDHGRIDRARLAQIVANPLNPHVHALPAKRRRTDAAVTFLIDTTGSMKVQRYEAVAVLCDTFVRSLETIGVQAEVLGFSTASWAGGASAAKWQAAGSPQDPGRLADTMHIVYKSFDRTWRQSRAGIAAMLRLDHYREGVDGEAIEWAAQRLLDCDADRRYLVLISDGQPMEATTAAHNRESLLLDHLRSVVDRVEQTTDIRLGAVSVDQSMEALVANSTAADLSGTLTLSTYDVLHHLFATKGTGTGVAAELASHPPFMVRTCHAKHERTEPEPFTT